MERRRFLTSSVVASALAGATPMSRLAAEEASRATDREYYELRLYQLRRGPQTKLANDFFRGAAIPAMNRAGIQRVGVFEVMVGPNSPTIYVLIPHKSLESVASLATQLAADEEYHRAGAPFVSAPSTEPAYVRVESSLMVAFEGMAKLEVPQADAQGGARIFELRTYESHSKKASLKKIEMFNSGEIAIFRRTGLRPVFFGETLIGPKMPQLTYMLTFENMEARDKNWAAFAADPEWKKLNAAPGYTDAEIVSNISNVILRPTSSSQI